MATRAVTQLYDDVLRPSGLRVTQFSILAAIARMGEPSVSQLADALAIDQTTLTRNVMVFERDALTERVSHPDARVKLMRLTAEGRKALEAARPLWARAQDIVLRELAGSGRARAVRVKRPALPSPPREVAQRPDVRRHRRDLRVRRSVPAIQRAPGPKARDSSRRTGSSR